MDEANTKSAGKKGPRKAAPVKAKAGNGKPTPAPRARKAAAVEPGFAPAVPAENSEAAPSPRISPEERHRLIAEAAYYRASQRGFSGGAEVEDWLAAEAEIDGKLLGR